VQFEITEQTRDAIAACVARAHLKSEHFLFTRTNTRRDFLQPFAYDIGLLLGFNELSAMACTVRAARQGGQRT
jgi:hypothetical protein